jgi:hypothetical protein
MESNSAVEVRMETRKGLPDRSGDLVNVLGEISASVSARAAPGQKKNL